MSIIVVDGYQPGALGRIAEMHAIHYAAHWGLGLTIETKVATGLAEFLPRFNPNRDLLRLAMDGDRIVGSIAVDGSQPGATSAQLRWFILEDRYQGRGLGRRLVGEAVAFCRHAGHRHVHLTTFEGLDAARHLYDAYGFRLVDQGIADQWGRSLNEQRFALDLGTTAPAQR